jgi:hypothetical protein
MDDTFDIPPTVVARMVGDEVVILDLDAGTYFGLDPVGARIWELIGEGLTLSNVRDRMLNEYDTQSDTLEQDILELIKALREESLVAVRG